MSEDWKVGDIAVCVDNNGIPVGYPRVMLTERGVYRVSRVGIDRDDGQQILQLEGVDATLDTVLGAYAASRFRRLNDGEGDADALERINACRKPAGIPALTPISTKPVRLSQDVWPAEVWAEIQAIYDTPDPFAEEL